MSLIGIAHMDTETKGPCMAEDLRIVKTRKAIREAFLTLRRTQPLERVRVRDICAEALINKSTFYHHYTDVFDLSDQLEDMVLDECFEAFQYKDKLLADPLVFLGNVPAAMGARKDAIDILFRGRQDVLYDKIERHLRQFYLTEDTTEEEDILLTFVIGGAMYAMRTLAAEGPYGRESVTEVSARIIDRLVQRE